MGIFDEMAKYGHEQLHFFQHRGTKLKAIVAIHNTVMGPALGGCRMRPYETEEDALFDVLRLSRGMTYKCGVADVDNGGGKSVLIGDPNADKTPEMFRAFGRYVEGLGGRFYTGTDMGTTPQDFVHSQRESTRFVGLPLEYGGSGNTAIPTALGVFQGIRATARELWGHEDLAGKTFAIQGVGKVGALVVEHLVHAGARVYITDVYQPFLDTLVDTTPKANMLGVVAPTEIYGLDVDMFIPCALGAILNDETIPQLMCKAIVGSANNQLLDMEKHGAQLHDLGILYAPDYLVNAGGLIQVADEMKGYVPERVLAKTNSIYQMLLQIYKLSKEQNIPTWLAADRLVEARIETIKDFKSVRI
ncbi:Leu/Phe/Val dehydrogenase [Tumebacillus permanentifrigoris]|uniref:Glutamate dehydrogenase/leucine dehydrogenase n=1 Tax=Tumebacillus permanentifrigoris TaxID=378543 RepID=A0A316D3P8_9BACL|nr:Glu/Leu/Phe/Val dehydrogenase [Tumebacillus permanentifrigoris]PWK05409.1 glutamate dehydrogenase/leucine dehydrogenase [Tumebacillus permanentifrigoris]